MSEAQKYDEHIYQRLIFKANRHLKKVNWQKWNQLTMTAVLT